MSLAPYLSTPIDVVEKMLEAAKLKAGEVLYDLGSGDGRIVIMTAEQHGVTAVGVELNEGRVEESRKTIREMVLEDKVQVIHGNILDVNISSADVVTLYLTTRANTKIKPKLESELRPRARVVSHDYEILGWHPIQVLHVYESSFVFDDEYYGSYTIYVYKNPRRSKSLAS